MSFEVRILKADELEDALRISQYAFNSSARHDDAAFQARLERVKQSYSPEWYLGAFEDGEMTSMMCIIPNQMYINGGAVSFGCVSPVASSPLHRRKGHTGRMMQESLAIMKQRGQALSGLHTPHPAFYRRYGWEIADEGCSYAFKPKDLSLQTEPRHRGRFRLLKPSDWQELDAVYQAFARTRNGAFLRSEGWWRHALLEPAWASPTDIVIWHNDAGAAEGYALYRQPGQGSDAGKLIVFELVALTSDARLNLLAYFGRHDLADQIVVWLDSDDPLPLQFGDAERVELRRSYGVLLRVCDFAAAMAVRPAATGDTCDLTLRVEDGSAPWNTGVWRVGVAEGRTWVEGTAAVPEITVSARTLAPLFNGYVSPATAASAGMLEVGSPGALERAGRVFAVTSPPRFLDSF